MADMTSPEDAPETAVEAPQDASQAPAEPTPTSTPEPTPAAPQTLADLAEGPPAETDEYRTGKWGDETNYICKGLRYGVTPCPFATLSYDEIIEHVTSQNNLHTRLDVDNFGNPVLFKD